MSWKSISAVNTRTINLKSVAVVSILTCNLVSVFGDFKSMANPAFNLFSAFHYFRSGAVVRNLALNLVSVFDDLKSVAVVINLNSLYCTVLFVICPEKHSVCFTVTGLSSKCSSRH
jgi:hypothetical protein